MAGILSKGIKLSYSVGATDVFTDLENLQEIPDLGGEPESVEVTVLSDAAHMYIPGLLNYGDSLGFKFLYEKTQFTALAALDDSVTWKVTLPDATTCTFSGRGSVKLDGAGTNAALTYTLNIKPETEMVFA